MKTEGKQRKTFYITDKTVDIIKKYAKEYGINESASVSMIIKSYDMQQEAINKLPDFMEQIKELKEKADILGLYEDGDAEGGDLSRKGV